MIAETLVNKDICIYFEVLPNLLPEACQTPKNLVWFNQHGGWSSYIFDCVAVRKVEVDGGRVIRYFDGYDVIAKRTTSGNIHNVLAIKHILPLRHLKFCYSLRISPQIYIFENSKYTPAIILPGSFREFKELEGRYTIEFELLDATEVKEIEL